MARKSIQYWLRLILIALSAILVWNGAAVALPFIVSLVMTLILLPIVNIMQDGLKDKLHLSYVPRILAILPAFLLVACVMYLAVLLVLTPFLTEFTRLVTNFPLIMKQVMGLLKDLPAGPGQTGMPPQIDNVITTAVAKFGNYSVELAQQGITKVLSLAGTLLELILVPIITFYLLKDGRALKHSVVKVFPPHVQIHLYNVVNQIHRTLGGYLRGQLLLATNMFFMGLIVAYIFDLPYPFVLALLGFIAEWLPIIGPFISAGPAIVLAALISGSLAFQVTIAYLIILLLDSQIIMPKVMGHIIKFPPVVIISVIFVGGYFYGVLGMMVAVPTTAILQIIIDRLWYFDSYYKKGDSL